MTPAAAPKYCMTCGAAYAPDALFCPKDGTPLTSAKGIARGNAGTAEVVPDSSGYTPPADPYLGRELADHIEIRQLAGAGAMGRVYRAFQRGIDRDVAVKILHRELSANQQLVARFHREAKVASRLSHPNVVSVHMAGQLPDGAMYIIMEYLDGLSLQSALAAAGNAMPLVRTLRIALQLCDAVGEAHAQGVVHRDLKPENVMLVKRGDDHDWVKVLDFGVARLAWGEQSMATAAGLIFGTAKYISPEGAQGEPVGPAGDVYAIATLVYQMLAGRAPFDAEQAVALLVQQIHDPPPPLASHARAAYVPPAIVAAVMKNLAKAQVERDPDARAFGRALLEAALRSGFVETDLVGRSSFTGQRPNTPVQMASLQRTSLSHDEVMAPTEKLGETQKWAPDDAPLTTPMSHPITGSERLSRPSPTPYFPSARGIDETMDDDSAPPAPAVQRVAPQRTEIAPIVTPAPIARPSAPPSPSIARPSSRPPPAHHDDDDEEPPQSRIFRARTWGVVVLCFLGGIVVFSAIAFRLKLLGSSKEGTLDDELSRARAALRLKHWDAPPGDNVRELTTDGLSKWPKEQRLLDIRAQATDEIALDAVRHELSGDQTEALHLARLARELDPTDTTAQHLVEKYEAAVALTDAGLPPLTVDAGSSKLPTTTTPSTGGPHVRLDVNPAKARVGQTVTFLVRAPKGKTVDGAHFDLMIEGQPTTLPAEGGEGGVYHGAFTFLQAGHYEVSFGGRIGSDAVHATHGVVVGAGDAPDPNAAPSGEPSANPAPSGSAKWL